MRKDKGGSVSIILPCAGRGTRLNLPYSKELVKISEGMSLIDYSFQHILASHLQPRVIVVIGPHKLDIARYVYEKYNDKVDLVFVFQKADHKGVTGATRSAEHLFGDKNILFLPSTIIEYKNNKVPLIDKMTGMLDRQPFVFMYKNENSITRLKLSGALHIQDQKVIDYEDKPLEHVEKYNAFCVSYGFKKEVFNEVISVIEQSVLKKDNFRQTFQKSVMCKTLAVEVAEYIDISTWTNLNAYLLRQYLMRSGVDPQFLKIRHP